MTSRTIWQDLYKNPNDNLLWEHFRKHYEKRVFTWAITMLDGNANAAEEITEDVFQNLYRAITNPATAQLEPRQNSFAGYVFQVVDHACVDYHRQVKRQTRLTNEMWKRIKSDESRRYLDRLISDAELEEEQSAAERAAERERIAAPKLLAELAASYAQAVHKYMQTQRTLKEKGKSWEMFLAAYSVEPYPGLGKKLDVEFSCNLRGYALKAAHRVAQALFKEMELPFETELEWERSERILRELVKRHGDPSK